MLWLFDSCGYLVGPAILLAGLCAVGLCGWASRPASSRRARRVALVAAAAPIVIALCGVLFGLIMCWLAQAPDSPWGALGKVCLAGLVVAALPLAWAMWLLRRRPHSVE